MLWSITTSAFGIFFLLFCFSIWPSVAQAQFDSLLFRIEPSDIDAKHEAWPLVKNQLDITSAIDIQKKLRSLRSKLQEAGYLEAGYLPTQCADKQCTCPLRVGPRYEWANLQNGNLSADLLSAAGFNESFYEARVFHYKELVKLQNKMLDYCENNGFPFAYIWLDSIRQDSLQRLSARLYIDYGEPFKLEELSVIGKQQDGIEKKVRISKRYLSNYLGLQPGDLYNESQIQKIRKRLRELPFLTLYQDPRVLFKGQKAQVLLFLQNRSASKFDVLFGLLPNTNVQTQKQQFTFTGNVNIDLFNPLGRGERIMAQWQQFQKGRSELRLAFLYPYLFNTPLGIDFKFELYRRDSTYIDVISDVGIQYLFDGNNYLKVFWKNSSTNVQNIDTARVLSSRTLPAILDLRNNTFGVEYYFQRLDYRWNPHKGFELKAIAGFGFKYIRRNSAVLGLQDPLQPDFDFGTLYDSLSTRSFQYSLQLAHSQFFPLWKSSTLMARYRGGLVFNSRKNLYTNELFRLGGNQIMRGFDEQSIFASWYNVATLEWRYMLGTNSYTYLFGDMGYVENKSSGVQNIAWPYGFGVGVALETKVGIFGLSYALGTNIGNPLLLRNGKIHFGYVNIF